MITAEIKSLLLRKFPGFVETLQRSEKIIRERTPAYACFLNAHKIYLAATNPDFNKVLLNASFITADGISVKLAGKIFKADRVTQVTGIDTALAMLAKASGKGWRVFFLGAQQAILQKCLKKCKKTYPGLIISGSLHGWRDWNNTEDVVDAISKSKSDILLIGVSSPIQEMWAHNNLERLNTPLILCVGGSFDVISGKTMVVPKLVRKLWLEWFWRFLQEPRRLWRKAFLVNFWFLGYILRARISHGTSKKLEV
ncbi:WecB/TagA/CpsF family glycosyltransferase [Elusimicrobiota bacterium]